MILFADTNVLLSALDRITKEDTFCISSVTIEELENIKTDRNRTEELRYSARKAVNWLNENEGKYKVVVYDKEIEKYQPDTLEINNDAKILACAKYEAENNDIVFVSNDNLARLIGKTYYGLKVDTFDDTPTDEYKGYVKKALSDNDMAYFYEHLNENMFGLCINQYVFIADENGHIVDSYKWNGETHSKTTYKPIKSRDLGSIKPLDESQECAFDSIENNDITVLYGKAGSGKTTIPLHYAMQGLEKGKISRIYFVYSFQPLKNQPTLGFEKGSHLEKLLNTASIGNILGTKLGGMYQVERMVEDGKINIIPTANLRGVEFESDAYVICTEAQNLDVYTLKTIIQRGKQGCHMVFEGDILEQKDVALKDYGMSRLIEVFKGHNSFGCVKLKKTHRSELCELADKL